MSAPQSPIRAFDATRIEEVRTEFDVMTESGIKLTAICIEQIHVYVNQWGEKRRVPGMIRVESANGQLIFRRGDFLYVMPAIGQESIRLIVSGDQRSKLRLP